MQGLTVDAERRERQEGRDGRKASRLPVGFTAKLRERGHSTMDVEVLDLSTSGFRIATLFRVSQGHLVWLSIPGLQPLEAVVRWSAKSEHGCEFVQPLHPAVVTHIRQLYPPIDETRHEFDRF